MQIWRLGTVDGTPNFRGKRGVSGSNRVPIDRISSDSYRLSIVTNQNDLWPFSCIDWSFQTRYILNKQGRNWGGLRLPPSPKMGCYGNCPDLKSFLKVVALGALVRTPRGEVELELHYKYIIALQWWKIWISGYRLIRESIAIKQTLNCLLLLLQSKRQNSPIAIATICYASAIKSRNSSVSQHSNNKTNLDMLNLKY